MISNAANGRANVNALVYGAVKLLPSAVLIIVSRPCLAQISAKSRWKPAENAWRVPTGRPFKLPDWPGFHWVGLLTSVMFDTCFHLIIFTVAGGCVQHGQGEALHHNDRR